jgi:hypothetical protein
MELLMPPRGGSERLLRLQKRLNLLVERLQEQFGHGRREPRRASADFGPVGEGVETRRRPDSVTTGYKFFEEYAL